MFFLFYICGEDFLGWQEILFLMFSATSVYVSLNYQTIAKTPLRDWTVPPQALRRSSVSCSTFLHQWLTKGRIRSFWQPAHQRVWKDAPIWPPRRWQNGSKQYSLFWSIPILPSWRELSWCNLCLPPFLILVTHRFHLLLVLYQLRYIREVQKGIMLG